MLNEDHVAVPDVQIKDYPFPETRPAGLVLKEAWMFRGAALIVVFIGPAVKDAKHRRSHSQHLGCQPFPIQNRRNFLSYRPGNELGNGKRNHRLLVEWSPPLYRACLCEYLGSQR